MAHPLRPRTAMSLLRYLQDLSPSRTILWCYFIWWLVNIIHHFDPTPRIWFTSLGLSAIIGVALILSTRPSSGTVITGTDPWVLFRLFLMPFCVSSFAALVKDAGYILIFPPSLKENTLGISLITAFLLIVLSIKKLTPQAASP